MANIEIRFNCESNESYATCELSSDEESVVVTVYNEKEYGYTVYLDKSTAIKFAKTVRTEIAKIKE